MRQQADHHHSRLDLEPLPRSASWWARWRFQLRRQVFLAFYPHPDSFFYPTRKRLLLSTLLLFLGYLFIGSYWRFWYENGPLIYPGLDVMTGVSLLAFLKVRFNLFPRLSDTALYPLFLWFCMPVFFIWGYFALDGRFPTTALLLLILLIYTNLLHWRVSAVGVLVAFGLSYVAFVCTHHQWDIPGAWEEKFLLIAAYVWGVWNSYTFAAADGQRYNQNVQILQAIGRRLSGALGAQLALSEALRHEAMVSPSEVIQARLLELVEKLDIRANLTRAELEEIEKDGTQLQRAGSTQLLRTSDVMPLVAQELQTCYGVSAEEGRSRLQIDCDEQVRVLGEPSEVAQMLASVLALALRLEAGLQITCRRIDRHTVFHIAPAGQALPFSQLKDEREWFSERPGALRAQHDKLAKQMLPAYSLYILKKIGGYLRFGTVQGGNPSCITVLLPLPAAARSRILAAGDAPQSLMAMYENRLR